MASIFREFEIGFKGKQYTSNITMDLINKIESKGVNIYQLAVSIEAGGIPPLSLIATMYATILQSCGVNVTSDEVWMEINGEDTVSIVINAKNIISCMFPTSEEPKVKKDKKTVK